MRYGIAVVVAVLWISPSAGGIACAASTEDSLRSNIHHESEEVFQKDLCQWRAGQVLLQGSRFLDVFPLETIKTVEVQGDEITLPTALVIEMLTQGRFETTKHPVAVGSAPAGRIRLKNGNCFQFNVLIDPSVRTISSIDTSIGEMSVPALPATCKAFALQARPGMTRAEVEKSMGPDGGIAVPFRYERDVARGPACGAKGEVLKVNLAFKPAGMSDAVYYLGKWAAPRPDPRDVLMRISPEYVEMPYYD